MWKEILKKRGIEESKLPKKVKQMIADYNEIQDGIVELEAELASEQDVNVKRELQSDLPTIRKTLLTLDKSISDIVSMMKLNEDGSVSTMNANDLIAAWESRINEFRAKEKKFKTKSIF